MTRYEVNEEYFNWLCGIVFNRRYSSSISFDKLLARLHEIEFVYLLDRDSNRAEKGVELRWRFVCANCYGDHIMQALEGPCSVLEMMVALALQCEEIMDDPKIGNRVGQWFWEMIGNLGLGSMTDMKFDQTYVDNTVYKFINREYKPNGEGGLFKIKNNSADLREVEIWYQLLWFIDSIA